MKKELLIIVAALIFGCLACGNDRTGKTSDGDALSDADTSPEADTADLDDGLSPADNDEVSTTDDASVTDDATELPDIDEDAAPIASWTDPATGLIWEKNPTETEVNWAQAVDHCGGLAGGAGWRLPDIDELRSLIRGCPGTVTGGSCNESVSCPGAGTDCCNEPCMGCEWLKGPGPGGCYWPDELKGLCDWYWSATAAGDLTSYACFAHFANGHLSHDDKANPMTHHVICVR